MAQSPQHPGKIMETETRFDLNAAVENWRQELAAQPQFTADERRELETHMLDAIAEFQRRGLIDEESFWLGRRRVGQPQKLSEEFVKANPTAVWRGRVFWMVAGVVAAWLLSQIIYGTESIAGLNAQVSSWIEPLQICVIATFFASGRLTNVSRRFQWFYQSRLHFGISMVSLIVITSFFSAEALALKQNLGANDVWHLIWHLFSRNLILASSFLLLLIWLLPQHNWNVAKRA